MAASHNYEIIIIPAKAKHSLFFFYNPNIHMMNVWFLLALLLLCSQLLLITNTNLALAADTPTFACDTAKNPGLANLTFCNRSLDMKTRVNDLIKRLTLEEKIGFLIDSSRGVSRLGIPNYEWWSEALHGVAKDGKATHFKSPVPGATSFPQPILTAASFNFSLFQTIGKVVSTEARAMYNVGQTGLTFWSPNVNIFRDPRWGRGQETPGEDPSLSATYAQYYVRGLQQRDDGAIDKLKVAACCKHYTAYDLENWRGNHRFTFNAVVTQQDLVDTFQVPFMSCVLQGKVASVMCSYNQVNGKPTCGDPKLLAGVIRGNWNLDGYIVSDCDSLDAMFTYQKYTKTPEETAALALNSGLNVNCQGFLQRYAQSAVDKRLVNISTIDIAIANNFRTLMRLGFFDGDPRRLFYGNLGPKDVCTPQNQELAREAARQGIVLLKNTVKSLPLSASAIKSLALIGPNANVTDTMLGNYAGIPCQYVTPLQGLEAHVSTVVYVPGCDNIFCKTAQVDDAQKIAAKADAVILVMGTNLSIEQEGVDRDDITLPGKQSHLVTSVAKVAKGPVILVLMSGGCLDVQFAKDNPKITSIFWVGFPGEKGGAALADLIFGLHSPSGKLPITWYPQSYVDKVNMTNMNMRPDLTKGYPGRTYRFYTGTPVFPFGFGLSYTLFHHSLVQAPDSVTLPLEDGHVCRSNACKSVDAVDRNCKNHAFDIHLRVKNKGKMSGSHTVLLFSSPPSVHNAPKKQLVAFEKLHLTPQEEGSVRFKVDVCKHLSVVDEAGKQKIALGKHVLHVGDVKHSFTVMI